MNRLERWYIGAVAVVGAIALAIDPRGRRHAVRPPHGPAGRADVGERVFPVRIPGLPVTIGVSEAFVFTLILLFGGTPAAVCVAIDGLLISKRRNTRSRTGSCSTWPSRSFRCSPPRRRSTGSRCPPLATKAATGFSAVLLPAGGHDRRVFPVQQRPERVRRGSEMRTSPYRVWRQHFIWLSLTYFAASSVAILLAINWPGISLGALAVALPRLLVFWLTFRLTIDKIEDANKHLAELQRLDMSTVEALAMAIDAKDQVTAGHLRRVKGYALGLANAIGVSDKKEMLAIEAAALLHDVGKVSVPDSILDKPGKLTPYRMSASSCMHPSGRRSCRWFRFPGRSCPSSATTTRTGTAPAIRTGCVAATSRWAPESWLSSIVTTR